MRVKCPSCGFESAEGAQWCDMCKQPFNKAKPVTPDDFLKKLASEEQKVPPVPAWARMAAWVFLGIWVIFGFILMGALLARYEDAKNNPPVPSANATQ
jgi:uncharacterized membrane protein YvbJ